MGLSLKELWVDWGRAGNTKELVCDGALWEHGAGPLG
jgi:hypothetical protein